MKESLGAKHIRVNKPLAFPRSVIPSASEGPRQWSWVTQASLHSYHPLVRSLEVFASRDDGHDGGTPSVRAGLALYARRARYTDQIKPRRLKSPMFSPA